MTFSDWMDKVDEALSARIGLTHEDLEDACYMDMYEDGYSPSAAARQVLEDLEDF